MKTTTRHLWPILILVALTLAVYGPSLGHRFLINWDDPAYVTNNALVRGLTLDHLHQAFSRFFVGNYAPVQIVSYMLDYSIWGMRAAGFIFDNILLHGASGILLYLLLCRMGLSRSPALIGAGLFLVHPVQVESVVWISQRKNVLAMFFYLMSLYGYLACREPKGRHPGLAYAGSLLCFVLALLAKSVTVVLPAVLLLYELCWLRERRVRNLALYLFPYLLAAAIVGYVALLSQSPAYGGGGRTGFHGGTPLATLITMLPVFVRYLQLILWPSGLSVVYAPPIRTAVDGTVLGAALLLALLAGLGVYLWRRDRRLFFWYAAIPIGLLPVSQIVPLVTLMNDRYLYFPMLGVAACAGMLCAKVLDRSGHRWHTPLLVAMCLMVAGYGTVASARSRVWQDSLTLWQDAVAKQPGSYVAWYTLGEVYEQQGRLQEAITAQQNARELCTGCRGPLLKLGGLYLLENDLPRMEQSVDELLRYYPADPEGYQLAGHLAYQRGEPQAAETAYRKALELNPEMTAAMISLGTVYLGTGRPAAARDLFRRAVREGGTTAELEYDQACAAAQLGDREEGLSHLAEALRLGFPRLDLIRQNRELAPLRSDPRFDRILQTSQEKGAR